MTSTVFHVRREVFSHGVLSCDLLHLSELNALTLAQQLSMAVLSHTSGSTAALKFTTWTQQAQDTLKCTEHTAKIYFETFLGVHPKTVHRAGGPKLLLSADLGEFLLFLFLQRFHSFHQHKDGTPPLLSYLAFITQHIHTLLLLIRDPHKHVHDLTLPLSPHSAHSPRTPSSPPSSSSPGSHLQATAGSGQSPTAGAASSLSLDAHEFNRLSFLLFAHNAALEAEEQRELVKHSTEMIPPEERKEVTDLSSLTPFFRGPATAVPLAVVEEWVVRHLSSTVQPALMAAPTVHHGHLVYPPLVKHTLVSQQSTASTWLNAADVQGGDVTLRALTNCSVHVQTHSRYGLIEDVSQSAVQAGVVSGLLVVRNCAHVTLTVACRSLHVADCRHVTIFLFCSTRPVVLGAHSDSIVLAPYNSFYPSLNADLAVTGLPTSVNTWSSPILMSSASGTTSSSLLHSPLRGSRSLGNSASSFTYHHHLSVTGHPHGLAPPSPPPPSSPRRSTSPSPLLASLSPPARDPRDPQSSPTSPFRRAATNPLSPSSLSPSSSSSSVSSLSATTSAIPERRREERRDSGDRGRGRERLRMSLTGVVKEVQEAGGGRGRRVHRMSDHEGEDSGSENSTDDERREDRREDRRDERVTGVFSRLHARSASYSAGERKDAQSSMSALRAHHSHGHHGGSDDHSPLHLSPSSVSPPFGPLLQPAVVNTLSPLTTTATPHSLSPNAAASSLGAFFPLSPHSASSSLAQAVTLLPPEHFFMLPPPIPARLEPPTAQPTTANPFPLPSLYADAMAERSTRAIQARSLIDAANLNAGEAELLQTKLEDGFEQWMRATFAAIVVDELVAGARGTAAVGDLVKQLTAAKPE